MERLNFEAEAIGFHLTAHPLDAYAKALRRIGATACAQVETSAQAGITRVRLAGVVGAQKERVTRTGNRMAWVRITDASGSCEVTLFAEVLSRSRNLLVSGTSVLVTADLRQDGEALRITAQDVVPLDQAAAAAGAAMRIWLRESASVPHIRDLLGREGHGKGRVILVPRLGTSQSVEIALPGGFNVTPRLAQALKVIPGIEQVEEL
jgi:DNA polymerase-3 subunit alpha